MACSRRPRAMKPRTRCTPAPPRGPPSRTSSPSTRRGATARPVGRASASSSSMRSRPRRPRARPPPSSRPPRRDWPSRRRSRAAAACWRPAPWRATDRTARRSRRPRSNRWTSASCSARPSPLRPSCADAEGDESGAARIDGTLYWAGFEFVRDAEGAAVDYAVSSSSGTDYDRSFAPVASIPEPGTPALFLGGALLLAAMRRGRVRGRR